jgi:predicted GIY-YIG superfamily endonuclease
MRSRLGKESIYIGESDNLWRRFGNYRNPGPSQQTSLRINAVLKSWLEAGGEISVAIMDEAWIDAETGQEKGDLSKKSIRRMFENFAVSSSHGDDVESLNR